MSGVMFLMVVLAIAGPVYFFIKEKQSGDPAYRWKSLAEELHLQFQPPASMVGRWKERELSWKADQGAALLECRFNAKRAVRLEIGPSTEVEKRAGIIVPDKVVLPDNSHTGFEDRYMIRCQPLEVGPALVDHSVRAKFAEFQNSYLIASNGVIQMRFPVLLRGKDLREAMDIAVSLAETLETM